MVEYRDVREVVRQGRYLGTPYVMLLWQGTEGVELAKIDVGDVEMLTSEGHKVFESVDEAVEYGRTLVEPQIEAMLAKEQGEDD